MCRFPRKLVVVSMALAASLGAAVPGVAELTASASPMVTFPEYLAAVEQNSLDLQGQRENVTAARAGVAIAAVRPDPQLTAGLASLELNSRNRQNAATATTVGLAMTFESAGKRGKRMRAAESDVRLTEANVGVSWRDLVAQSVSAFTEACRSREALARKQSSLESFRQIVGANETRLKVGDIGMLELRQSRVESDRFHADVVSAGADADAAEVSLSLPLGKRFAEVFPGARVDCAPKPAPFRFELGDLIREALENSADVRVAKAAVESARAKVSLAYANRWIDPTLDAGVIHVPQVEPRFDRAGNVTNSPTLAGSIALGLTVTIPVPFSRLQRGELVQSESLLTQADLQLRSTLLKAETEVRANCARFQAAAVNVRSYSEHVLVDADRVLDGVRLSYRKGAASLVELLNAQRSADDVYLSYLQAVADMANARASLQLSAGMRPEL